MKKSWIIWYAVIIHILWGILLLVDSATANITAIHSLYEIFGSTKLTGIITLSAGVLAFLGVMSKGKRSFVLLLPQQFLLIISAIGAVHAVETSSFADGVLRPRAFILADQSPAILACILHTIAILENHAKAIWKQLF